MKTFVLEVGKTLASAWKFVIYAACWATVAVVALISLLASAGIEHRTVLTGSMVPTYNVGDILWYAPSSGPLGDDLRVGQAVLIAPEGNAENAYTHRVASIDDDGTVNTAGDAFAGEGLTDIYHPTQADVLAIPFTVMNDPVARWVFAQVSNELLVKGLLGLGLVTWFVNYLVIARLRRKEAEQWAAFRARWNEAEDALVAAGIISPVGGEPPDDDPLDTLDSDAGSTRT